MTGTGAARMVYTPHDLGVGVEIGYRKQTEADFRAVWQGGCEAVLIFRLVTGPKPFLLVAFQNPIVLRSLDEMWACIEPQPEWEGDPSSFCQTVEGATYPTSMEVIRSVEPEAKLYQFVTGDICVEVISSSPPTAVLAAHAELPVFPAISE